MLFKVRFGLLAVVCLGLALCLPQATGGSGTSAAAAPLAVNADDPAVLRAVLKATSEEWSVIYPQLERISSLRDELHATAQIAIPDRRTMFGGALDGPMGGTSLDTPVMPERFANGRSGARSAPFDPKNAPGRATDSTPTLLRTLRGLAGHAMINVILADQQHPVAAAITELQNLLDSPTATDDQFREKLAAVRAVRSKMARDLETAQNDLTPYLTLEQTAILVSFGYLD